MTEGMEPKPVKVLFKHEGEVDRMPVGPMRVMYEDDNPDTSQRYDPDQPHDDWVHLSEALATAEALGVPLDAR